jgi:hypothetical protein
MFENEDPEGDVTDVVETPAADPVVEAPAWDEKPETLEAQDFYKALPEKARAHLSELREEARVAKERATYLDRIFNSDDATAELQKVIAARDTELAGLKQSLEALGAESTGYRDRATALEQRIADAEEDREYERLSTTFKDIHDDFKEAAEGAEASGAWAKFITLLNKGIPEEEAALVARALLPKVEPAVVAAPAKPATREVKPPPGVAAASKGGNTPQAVVSLKEANEDFETRLQRMRREAEQEA